MQSYKLARRITPYIRPRLPLVLLGYGCALLAVVLNMTNPILFSVLIDRVLIEGKREWLVPLLALSVGLAIGSALLGTLRSIVFRYLGIRHTLDFRERVLAHMRRIPLPEIEKHGPGKFAPLLGWDTANLANYLNSVVVELVIQGLTMSVAVAMIFYMDWRLGIAALVSIPLLVMVPRLYRKPLSRAAGHIRTHNEEVGSFMFEAIQGSREIRAFGLEGWEAGRNEKLYRDLVASSTIEAGYRTLAGQSSGFAMSVVIVCLYGFGSGQVLNGELTIGLLVAAVQYFYNLLQPLLIMNNFYGDIKQAEVAMERIEHFFAIPAEPMAATPPSHAAASGSMEKEERRERTLPSVISSRLNVSYDGIDLLQDVEFAVLPGQAAAFVGRSGAGKSTLFKALLGFMPIESGELVLADKPFGQWTRAELCRSVGAVFQETFIFIGTLHDNIALGDPSFSEEEVYEAACLAGLKTFVDSLPEGLHTRVDNQGFQLSGGQRQRMAIARVMLRKPDILILDEPTSALDRATEEQVLAALDELMKGKTTLVSTHRIETIRTADVIYVMDRGRIVDSGTHEELSTRSRYYRDLLKEPDMAAEEVVPSA